MIDYAALGTRIRQARAERGFTQERLAEMVNISLSHMSNIETGRTKVSLTILVDLANTLNVTVGYLLESAFGGRQPVVLHEIDHVLADCSEEELAFLLDAVKSLKSSHRRHFPPSHADKR